MRLPASSFVPRTVTVVDGEQNRSAPLEEFRSVEAYVLLGDPGAGKTRAFQIEGNVNRDSEFVTARRFIRKSLDRVDIWKGKTLFIDGLDEARASGGDPRRPLDDILERLDRLGRPKFRLSCRAADWLGRNDLQEIVSGAGYTDPCVLHLEPLTDSDIRRILGDLGESNIDRFLDKARERGLDGLLDNPQLLWLLTEATREGEWPNHRRGIFDLACRKLAREWNNEHRAAQRNATPVPVDRIVSATGHLAALLLLSDMDRVSLDASEEPDALAPEDIPDGDEDALVRAVKSNLFEGLPDGGFAPVHRQLSEFLAGRFLHERIEAGVPAGRILALMAGGDGIVVNELRGLSAWLAAFDPASRSRLVETDPVGVALYGDVSGFGGHELEHLLGAFADEAEHVRSWFWPATALASLVTGHTLRLLFRYLGEEDRTEGRQTVVGLLLHALSRAGGPAPCLNTLDRTIRDASWGPWVRRPALRALLHHSISKEAVALMVRLLDDLRDGSVEDRDNELLGMLLKHLYPAVVGPERVWDYVVPQNFFGPVGSYRLFWSAHLIGITGETEMVRRQRLAALMRSLSKRRATLQEELRHDGLRRVVRKLVNEALVTASDDLTAPTVCTWLELTNFEELESAQARTAEHIEIGRWLAERPKLQKALALESLRRIFETAEDRSGSCGHQGARGHSRRGRSTGIEDGSFRAWRVRQSIFRSGEPHDFATWCLDRAVEVAGTSMGTARALLDWSRPWRESGSAPGLAITDVRRATAGMLALQKEVERFWEGQNDAEVREARLRAKKEEREYESKRRQEEAEFIAYVREQARDLSQASCPPRLLHHIAQAYHGIFLDQREATPHLRVLKLLQKHEELADAAFQGFRRVVERDDLPTLQEVVQLNKRKQMSLFALPVLAGFDLMGPETIDSRGPEEIARAVAFYLVTHLNVEGHPLWYRRALQHHPEAVAQALIKVTRSRIRDRRECLYLWDLARNRSYGEVVRQAALPLLRAFPTRCTEPQVTALHQLLLAALKWRVDGLDEFIGDKASKPDMDVSQRAVWLTAGLIRSPRLYVPEITVFLEQGEEARSRQMVRLLAPTEMKLFPMRWETAELGTMIELLGRRYSPWRPEGFGMASIVDEDREKVEALISRWGATLASRTDRDASRVLHALTEDPALESWRYLLAGKRADQVVACRNATHVVPSFHSVRKTLANAEPANPADLAALVADRLERLGTEIQHGNDDAAWRPFWNEDSHGRRASPKREESCSKALVSALRSLLPRGVEVHREFPHTRDNRSDIRISFNGHAIPIEVKKESHKQLWRAALDQLARKYVIPPESSGFGIYLVLWFGLKKMPVPPDGRRPTTPEALRDHLQKQVPSPHRHKITVVVLDVSGAAPGQARSPG